MADRINRRRINFSRIKEPVFPVRNPAAKEFSDDRSRPDRAMLFACSCRGRRPNHAPRLAPTHATAHPPPPPAAGDPPNPSVRETPPDQKAYNEASKITDNEKKIAALEKLKTDFPGSMYASIADSQIFSTAIQKMPEQKDRIRKAAKAMFAEAVAKDKSASKANTFATTAARGSTATRIADLLLIGNLLLRDAASYARKGVEALQENVWTAERRESYAKRKQKIPPPEELAKDFATARAGPPGAPGRAGGTNGRAGRGDTSPPREERPRDSPPARAARVGTRGRVELKLGRTAEARKLLEES